MTKPARGVPLGSWLAELPDEGLIRLLELRPDLAQPPPGSIAALAARAQARQSVRAATDELDFLRLAVLDALLVLDADAAAVPLADLLALIGDRAPADAVHAALTDLIERALCWGSDGGSARLDEGEAKLGPPHSPQPDGVLRVVAEAGAGLPWHPGQVTREDPEQSPEQIREAVADLDAPQRDLLDKLLAGSPIGRTRDAAPGAPPEHPVPRLLAAGLLRRIDDETVILPRLVGQVLRGEQPGPVTLQAPDPVVSQTTAADVDATAAGAVIDLLRELDVLLANLGDTPVPELRSGGLGVREVKRLAKSTGIDETRLGLLLEVAATARLIASDYPDPATVDQRDWPDADGPYWAPTVLADRFAERSTAERWHLLAGTWLQLPARPGLIGSRGADGKPRAALSTPLFSTAAPLDRRLLLGMLAELPDGAGTDAVSASQALIWRRPRWASRLQPGPVGELLDEAHALGVLGRGALSSPGRALLAETWSEGAAEPATSATVSSMTKALPEPIDHFLVQADLTVVVPGPLERDLAEELGVVASVESAGAAMVYRVSEQTIRAALDVGRTGAGLHAFFGKHSKTPVPQGLTYLIDDVARRHGQLRIGMAASFVRCEDPALLAQAVAVPAAEALGLRLLAPTVAVAQAPIADVLTTLRDAGFAPAAEDATGTIVDIRPRGVRVPTPAERRSHRPVAGPSGESLTSLVRVLRTVTSAPFDNIRLEPVTAMILLKRAAAEGSTVLISYVDAAGVATQREVSPVLVRGGQLVAFDSTSGQMREFTIHRITSISAADGNQ
ncbi:helicase-associated domain-containing protein [Mycolicibacter sinensis]|uniref:DNA-binding protein n=1 Tax=Mycolicibacter sinensis (strain JDM601) TaxID=875328 RepID=A0A1A2NIE4_MYCSD|nr:helicase-associated domain-containing protein [Mycolicibacter sinensis]OBH14850.1 DNA-binding protein [Mycolicibacter sinensis]OBI30498.1 DNA-binding protein [Mycolicibacter sinensis]